MTITGVLSFAAAIRGAGTIRDYLALAQQVSADDDR